MPRLRLRDNVHIGIEYDDRTRFGSPIGSRPDQCVREIFQPLLDYAAAHGYVAMAREAPALLAEVVRGEIFNHITEPDGAGAWRVKPEILFPDPGQARPFAVALVREDTDRHVRAELPAAYWPSVHTLLAQLAGGGCDPEAADLHPDVRAMLKGMIDEDLVEDADAAAPPDPRLAEAGLTFLGHNTVVVRSNTARLIVDPFLFAGSAAFPAGYQPLQLRELGAIDAVLITHSHPDHFDPSTLLRFPLETRIIVPRVDRETILAIAMERRLRELGFNHISVMDWGQSTLVGDIEVHALPFYGEQATDGDVLHPAIRNAGNTYLVRTPAFSAAFLADSGRDGQGDVRDVAVRTRARLGPVDVVFSGFRGWLTYPAQYLFS
ncbi:MAG: MBL fold metallo-hydrolase, partial [Dehalococcoidia bacterium]